MIRKIKLWMQEHNSGHTKNTVIKNSNCQNSCASYLYLTTVMIQLVEDTGSLKVWRKQKVQDTRIKIFGM